MGSTKFFLSDEVGSVRLLSEPPIIFIAVSASSSMLRSFESVVSSISSPSARSCSMLVEILGSASTSPLRSLCPFAKPLYLARSFSSCPSLLAIVSIVSPLLAIAT